MKKLIGLLLVLALAVAACGGDDGGADYKNPESIGTCDELLDAGIDMLQDFLDDVAELDLAALASDEPPAELAELETNGEALEARAAQLNCSTAELDAGIAQRVDDLKVDSDNVIGQFILQGIQSGSGGFFEG